MRPSTDRTATSARRVRILAAIVASVLPAACGGSDEPAAPPPVEQPAKLRNVVLISIDTLNRDALGCYDEGAGALPFLDAFAAECVRFDNALSTSPWTLPSHASLLTGLYPDRHGATDPRVRMATGIATLAGELSARYETVGFTDGGYLDPAYGFDAGFGRYEASAGAGPVGTDASGIDRVFAQAIDFVTSRPEGAKPFFLFLQTFFVHNYYQDPLNVVDAQGDLGVDQRNMAWLTGRKTCKPEKWGELRQAYLRRVERMDGDVAALAKALEEKGLWEDCVLVFTSDHGEGFDIERRRVHHGGRVDADLIRIPFLVRMPGVAPRAEEAFVSHVDVMPTLLELAGMRVPPGLDGVSIAGLLSNAPVAPPERTLFALEHAYYWEEGRRKRVADVSALPTGIAAVRDGIWYVRTGSDGRSVAGGAGGADACYDVRADPAQRSALPGGAPDAVLGAVDARLRERPDTGPRGESAVLDEHLRKLGYTE